MKFPMTTLLLPCLAVLALMTSSCAPRARMACQPEVRAQSATDYGTFTQLMGGTGGVAFADEVVEKQTKGRELVKVEPLAAGNIRDAGKERWTVRHADGGLAAYHVKWLGPFAEVMPEKQLKGRRGEGVCRVIGDRWKGGGGMAVPPNASAKWSARSACGNRSTGRPEAPGDLKLPGAPDML